MEASASLDRPAARPRHRLAATFLIALLAAGSLTLWIAVPAGCLWLASRLTDSAASHFLVGVALVPAGMALFAPWLFWVNGLYLRVVGAARPAGDDEDESPRLRGPLEPLLVASLVVAIAAFCVWFFVFAENPPGHGAY